MYYIIYITCILHISYILMYYISYDLLHYIFIICYIMYYIICIIYYIYLSKRRMEEKNCGYSSGAERNQSWVLAKVHKRCMSSLPSIFCKICDAMLPDQFPAAQGQTVLLSWRVADFVSQVFSFLDLCTCSVRACKDRMWVACSLPMPCSWCLTICELFGCSVPALASPFALWLWNACRCARITVRDVTKERVPLCSYHRPRCDTQTWVLLLHATHAAMCVHCSVDLMLIAKSR